MPTSEFGERLKAAMTEAAIPAVVLARAVGVSAATVSRWRNGSLHPSRKHLREIAQLVGRSVTYMEEGGEEEQGPELWHRRFATLILQGVDADKALEIVASGVVEKLAAPDPAVIARLTEEDRELLRQATPGMRRDLEEQSEGRWSVLSPEQQTEILARIERLSRGDDSPET